MTLTMGHGPFGHQPSGIFDFEPPAHVVFVEPFPRRVRAVVDGLNVADSERVMLVYESRTLPHFAFPREDVGVAAEPEPHVDGYVTLPWDSVEAWYEEDEQVFVHPRDPYHRIDTVSTSREIRVSLDGQVLAESTGVKALYETGLPIRYYFPLHDVRLGLIERSDTVTECAYKGTTVHWSAKVGDTVVADVAWTYEGDGVRREAEDVRGRVCFYDERVDVDIDGVRQARPQTPWSRPED